MPRSTKPVLLQDVAQRAGVSRTTASVVLNGKDDRIPVATQERVRAAAEELGYRPNGLARSLRTRRSMTLALVSDEIAALPFAGAMVQGAQEAAWEAGYVLVTVDTGRDAEVEAAVVTELRHRQVEGFLYAANYHSVRTPPPVLAGAPTVLLDATEPTGRLSSVVPDEYGGARAAVEHLLAAGHRRIGYLGNLADIPATHLRRRAYEDALTDAAIAADPALVVDTIPEDRAHASASAEHLLSLPDRPTALFCFSDRAAAGAYVAARRLGLRVPSDLSVVGFDNLELVADWLDPGLTTIQLPHADMGRWAAAELVQAIGDPDRPAVQHLAPCPVVERGSVAPPSL